ncbi:DUF2586 family protein [Flavobacterium beibuense]|uniref:DUF2586 family protein n=1 Tax=Flavobacterium beibuense TaxID=657326 RepID=UPI003A91DB20
MAKQEGVSIEKLQGGLNRLASGTDNHLSLVLSGLPVGEVATAINNNGKGVAITSLYAAEQLGINESFDANNNITAHEDISEFFRLAPEGTLYLFDLATETEFKAFLNQNKEIKGYALYITYDTETPNLVTTINAQQAIINSFAAVNRQIDFAIVAPNGLNAFTEDLTELSAPNVSVVIACHGSNGVAGLGAALGMLAARKVNENLGSVNIQKKPLAKRGFPTYPLTDDTLGKWLTAYLTDGTEINALPQDTFNDIVSKGYILAAPYEGFAGIYFENSYTCIDSVSDFAFIENNRTWNKAARIVRTTLLPEVKGTVKKDPQTGYMTTTTVQRWTTLVNRALDQMVNDDEISSYEVYINPQQIVNSTTPVNVQVSVVADGIVHKFAVQLGLTNTI